MNLKLTDSEKDSTLRVITESIQSLKSYGSLEDFTHLANLLYVYKKITGENFGEGDQNENNND